MTSSHCMLISLPVLVDEFLSSVAVAVVRRRILVVDVGVPGVDYLVSLLPGRMSFWIVVPNPNRLSHLAG